MSRQFEIAKQIIEETCPKRKLQLGSIRLFAEIIQCKKYQKGDVILNEGDVCNSLFYIEQGLVRQHYVKYGKDMTEHISCERNIVWCIQSYFNQKPTRLTIEALEPCIIWEIPREAMEREADVNSDFAYLYRRIFEDSLILSQIKADILRFESAKDKYNKLMQLFPEIIQRAPLTYIASYLQMSLETLSRVRSSISL